MTLIIHSTLPTLLQSYVQEKMTVTTWLHMDLWSLVCMDKAKGYHEGLILQGFGSSYDQVLKVAMKHLGCRMR
jgi:hypothetical protein